MKLGIIILWISFLLDGLVSHFIPYQISNISLFRPMFTITSLILIYPYFNKEDDNFYRAVTLCGFCYDIVYTNSLPLNTLLFFMLAIIVKIMNNILANNIINVIIMTIITITIFDLSNFFILNIIDYTNISFYDVSYKILNSLFFNIIYVVILFIWLRYISDKYRIKHID